MPEGGGARLALASLILLTALLYGARLGALDFWAPDEPRYGAIAEEIRSFRHGGSGLFLLHLNDTPYTQKPPLYFWLAAAIGAPFGHVSEGAARLPSAIAGVLAVALTAIAARRLLGDPRAAWLAGALLATSFRFAFTARRAQLDVLLTLFELIAILVFLRLEFQRGALAGDDRPDAGSIAAIHGALGLGALVKGPVAWLPLAVFWTYLAWEGRGRRMKQLMPPWALLLSVAPVCAWMGVAVSLAPPGFADVAIGENLIGRFFSGTSHARPFYYFFYQTPADFLPWTLLLPWAVKPMRAALRQSDPKARFLAAWVVIPLIFFSLSAGKRGVYMLPCFPAIAMIATMAVARPGSAPLESDGETGPGQGWGPRWPGRAGLTGWIGAVALIELIAVTLVLPHPRLALEKSPRPIAEAVAARTRPDQAVGVYELGPLLGPIGYYGDRRAVDLVGEPALRAHLAEPGAIVLLRARHFEQFRAVLDLREQRRFRSGKRALVLALAKPGPGEFSPPGQSSGFTPTQAVDAPRSPNMRRFSP